MAKKFLPLFLDFNEMTQDLSDEECGRLVRALVQYARGEDYEDFLGDGMDRLAFRFMRGALDRNASISEKRAETGAKGGKQTQANAKQNEANAKQSSSNAQAKHEQTESKTPINNNNNNNNNKNNNKNNNESSSSLPPSSLMDDDDAHAIQGEQNQVLNAAENAGFQMSNMVRARLIALYADSGLKKMLDGIESCSKHGATNLAYLEAVLKGSPKKAKPKVNAQDYDQRSYDEVSDEIMQEQIRDMEEWMKRGGSG